jgi:spore coat protein U-like protein
MRNILLATAALAIVGTGTAMAAGPQTQGVQVTATVTASCSLTDPDDVSFGPDPLVGATDTSNFSFTCNFAGDGGEGALQIGIESDNGGLANPADGTDRSYTISYEGGTPFTAASAEGAPVLIPESSTTAGVAELRSFEVALAEALPVAGSYSDTLTVSVAP